MSDFHISLYYKGQPCHFDLIKSDSGLTIGGNTYQIRSEQMSLVNEILKGLSVSSEGELDGRIKSLANTADVSVTKIGTRVLGPWIERENYKRIDMLPEKFKGRGLASHEIFDIYLAEGLPYPLGSPKTEPYEITQEDLSNLQNYLTAIKFTGVVRISDEKGAYTVSAKGQEMFENAPYPIHSIGKIFTGAVLLLTMPEDSYNQPLDLDLKDIPDAVQEHIRKNRPTLLQTMTHRAGFGDYLGNYEKAIMRGENPAITKPEDFLKFADTEFYPLDEEHYSNLGTLLSALAGQHKIGKPYDRLLQESLLNQGKISISATKPPGARYNRADPCQGRVVGGPAGGYWATAGELHKLGTFLKEKCRQDPLFLSKMERFGKEFYVTEDREIRHNGCSASGSSLVSSFLDCGITITILSDQGNFMADKIYHTIRENLIEKQ